MKSWDRLGVRHQKGKTMFRLEKCFRFEAAHMLPSHDGKCKRLHGHSWVGTVIVEGEELYPPRSEKAGMVMDFGDLSLLVKHLNETYLDHQYLNETLLPFGIENPTSEEIARWLFNQLEKSVKEKGEGVKLVEVRVDETCTSSCIYRPRCPLPVGSYPAPLPRDVE